MYLGKLIGISQKGALKLGHAIRKMMDPGSELVPALCGIAELNENYIGGKPRYQKSVVHIRDKGTDKQCELVAVECNGPVWSAPVPNDSIVHLSPVIDRSVDKRAHLIDELHAFIMIGKLRNLLSGAGLTVFVLILGYRSVNK